MVDPSAYFDAEGRLTLWPSAKKRPMRAAILDRMANLFDHDRAYRETEVNALLRAAMTYDDHVLIRRELVDSDRLSRTNDGASYWRPRPEGANLEPLNAENP